MSVRLLQLLSSAIPEAADADLLGRFVASRDEAAFTELVRRHGPAVLRVCRRLAGQSADDAFQATFLVLACRAASVRKAPSVGSWLIGVAGRVARQTRRVLRRQEAGDRRQSELPGRSPSPDSCLLSPELGAALDDELSRLPESLRAAVVLCLVEGRTQEQAAGAMGGSVRTVRRRLDEAKALLRSRLERRGVVPTVAAALVTSIPPAAAVHPELVRRTAGVVFEFLAGGEAVRATPAVLAKGVLASMVTLKAKLLVPIAAVLAVGLGVVWGNAQQPGRQPGEPLRPPAAPELPGQRDPGTAKITMPVETFELIAGGKAATHRTSNFIVHAPTAVIARAVAAEAEFQRERIAKAWIGKALPAWVKPATITVTEVWNGSGGATTFTFGHDKTEPRITSINMELRGVPLAVLSELLPHEVAHTVLATHFGKPLPRWADEGVALLHESDESQARHDELARKLLSEGRGVRLKTLFRMTEYPRDMQVLYAQGYSICRFLLERGKQLPEPVSGEHAALLEFVRIGMDGNTAASWEKAAKDVYGFDSVDKLEEAWIDSLRTHPNSATPPARPKDDKPDLIPPTKLPSATAPRP